MAGDARIETIRELCGFEGRIAGTDAERRAGNHLAGRLRALGRRAEVEPTYVHPQAPLIWAAHCALAIAGSLVAVAEPAAGFAVVLLAATSLYLDLNGGRYLLRRLFFRRASQNVVSPGPNPGAPVRLVLVAHYDSGRTGLLFAPKQIARARRFSSLLGFPHTRLLFWSVALLLPLLGARMAGAESTAIAAAQLLPTLILLAGGYLLVDLQLSRVSPGANDNASGVAVALSLAERLEPDNLDPWIVLTGAGASGIEGMRSFVRSRRKEFAPEATIVIAIDSVGAGDVRWVASEGLTVPYRMDRRTLELCEAVAEAGADRDHPAGPLSRGSASDALAARTAGWRATTITCLEPGAAAPARAHTAEDLPDAVDGAALARTEEFVLSLVSALDREADRTRADGPR